MNETPSRTKQEQAHFRPPEVQQLGSFVCNWQRVRSLRVYKSPKTNAEIKVTKYDNTISPEDEGALMFLVGTNIGGERLGSLFENIPIVQFD